LETAKVWGDGVRGEKARERIKCKMDGERALMELLSGASSGELYKSYYRLLREREKCGLQIRLSLLIEIHCLSFFFFFFGANLRQFEKIFWKRIFCHEFPVFLEKGSPEFELIVFAINRHKFPTI
jgi:hypothetical protein